MDIVELVDTLLHGGPTALFLILAALILYLNLRISKIEQHQSTLEYTFNSFQVRYAEEKIKEDDLDEVKTLIRENRDSTKILIGKLFDKLDAHLAFCGKGCGCSKCDGK